MLRYPRIALAWEKVIPEKGDAFSLKLKATTKTHVRQNCSREDERKGF